MEITKIEKRKDLRQGTFDNAWFLHLSEPGAMGGPGEVTIVTKKGECYEFSYIKGEITFDDFRAVFPKIDEFGSFLGNVFSLPQGWQYAYLGFGNHLLISNEIYDEFHKEIKEYTTPSKLYGKWLEKAEQVIKNRN